MGQDIAALGMPRARGAALEALARTVVGDPAIFTPRADLESAIAALGMPRARGAALEALARTVAADPAIFTPRADLESAIKALSDLPGIGAWTAQYIALRELREPDAFPQADIGLMRAMADGSGVRPTADQLLARSERWRPWRAYAAQHLWAADAAQTASMRSRKHDRRVA